MNKISVLITASTLPRWESDVVPTFVLDQARSLFRLHPDLDVHILAPHHEGAAHCEEVNGITLHRFRYFWPASMEKLVYPAILPNLRTHKWLIALVPFLMISEAIAIFCLCRKIRPQLLYSHWFMPQAVCGSAVARLLDIPHVFTSHSSDVEIMHKLPWIGPWLVRSTVRRMKACTVVSRRSLEKLKSFFPGDSWNLVAQQVSVIPMGVETDAFTKSGQTSAEARASLGLSDVPTILFIGRLSEKKGIPYLLDAFARLAAQHPNTHLVIAGDGEMRTPVEQQIATLGLGDRVSMPGYVNGDEKRAYLTAADIFTVPSIITSDGDAEGLPVSLMEGMAAGKINVATCESGADDILTDGQDGFLVEQKSVGQLHDALEKALTIDDDRRTQMKEAARETIRQLDWSLIGKRHYSVLFNKVAKLDKAQSDGLATEI